MYSLRQAKGETTLLVVRDMFEAPLTPPRGLIPLWIALSSLLLIGDVWAAMSIMLMAMMIEYAILDEVDDDHFGS